ncbi:MAG: response regulator [Verrucomicrobia bacterium]|jgi:DNA-binding response OmpR family regulator|nr:response regulator [Verrucomicrobiota bacterium]
MSDQAQEMETILVVEDNEDVRLVLLTELEDEYEVLVATDGREGLDMAVLDVPDLVITDIMMPVLSGLELCKALKANEVTNHIPVVMLTARGKEDEQVEGLEVGANDYISKPFSIPILKMRIHNLLESRRNYRMLILQQLDKDGGIEAVSFEDRFMERVVKLVGDHMADPDFGVEQLAAKMNMADRTLQRKLKAMTDTTPQDVIRSMRLNRACDLLKNSSLSVSEVAYQTGYLEPTNFGRSFKKQFGFPPSQCRSEEGCE